ncbi:MAG: rhomboid family intramembrane serine protease [Cyanobacteria bacterium SZAS TMP-1]|nr:rhomboid family intramembrane serine protease [Cyanobacteria bacterium SZAS TMP-1]
MSTTSTKTAVRVPWTTLAIIWICIIVLPFRAPLSIVPAFVTYAFTEHWASIPLATASFVAYMFQHEGFQHMAYNIVPFLLLGAALEEAIGHRNFALFVLATGIGAGLVQYLVMPEEILGIVGLSGVVIGTLVVITLAAPNCTLFSFPAFGREISARVYHLTLFILAKQLYSFFGADESRGLDLTAYWVHFGGAVVAVTLWYFWLRTKIEAYKNTPRGARLFA